MMMGTQYILRAVAPLLLIASCGPSKSETDGLLQIEVLPANATVTVDNAPAAPIAYTAVGHYADGHSVELGDVEFSLDAPPMQLPPLPHTQFTASHPPPPP